MLRKFKPVRRLVRRACKVFARAVRAVLKRVQGGGQGARQSDGADVFAPVTAARRHAGKAACGLLEGKQTLRVRPLRRAGSQSGLLAEYSQLQPRPELRRSFARIETRIRAEGQSIAAYRARARFGR